MTEFPSRAVVIGASISGLLAARVLADYYESQQNMTVRKLGEQRCCGSPKPVVTATTTGDRPSRNLSNRPRATASPNASWPIALPVMSAISSDSR